MVGVTGMISRAHGRTKPRRASASSSSITTADMLLLSTRRSMRTDAAARQDRGRRQCEQRRIGGGALGALSGRDGGQAGREVGFAAANNIGIAMLDDCELHRVAQPDAFAEPGWLEQLVAAAADPPRYRRVREPDRAGGRFRPARLAGDVYHVYGTAWPASMASPSPRRRRRRRSSGPRAQRRFYRREWLVRLGGFDESVLLLLRRRRPQPAPPRRRRALPLRARRPGAARRWPSSGGLSPVHDLPLAAQPRLDVCKVDARPHPLALPRHALLLNVGSVISYGARGHTRTLLRAKRDAVLGLPRMLRARRSVMRSTDYDRPAFDRIMRHGAMQLLRETRS